ncbi:MAG: hypothetical protein OEM62_08540 [Acidobacteriota bacterium]|nr:hypothetical protein [Acidobacteriota bacterium]
MSENRFLVAGWATIAAAGLMPTAFIVAGIEQAAFDLNVTKRTVGLLTSDFLLLVFGGVAIYVLVELKRMLYERYSYRGLDVIIALAIGWTVVNYGGSFLLQSFFTIADSTTSATAQAVTTVFWIISIGVFGIIDAILGLMLLIQGRRFGTPLLVFAALSLAMGLCGLTVILSVFSLLLFPVAYIALAVAFLRPEERLEFV